MWRSWPRSGDSGASDERGVEIRILIAYEERHHLYSDAIEDFLSKRRPHISVLNVPFKELEEQLERFVPHLAVSSESNRADPGGMAAWIELSPEPAEPSKFCLDGEHSEASNPRLAELLEVVDEAEELVQTGADPTGC